MAISKLYGNKIAIDNTVVTVDIVNHDGSTKGLMLASVLVTATAAELNAAGVVGATTSTAAELNYLDLVTLGTGAASKAVVLDAGEDYTWPAAGVLTYGVLADASTTLGATVDELNRGNDLSARVVTLAATTVITEVLHEGRDCYITETGTLATFTLPEATGGGGRYRFICGSVNTSNNVFVVADTTNANYIGNIVTQDADLIGTIGAEIMLSPANSDTLTLDGTTGGGQKGDWVEFIDVATDVWFVNGITSVPAGSNVANPFSAAV